jgi:hypothetical protein
MANRADKLEIEKRIHQVGLLLPRKTKKMIVEFIGKTWGIEKSQAYDYIGLAEKEWAKYFSQVERCGKAYYFAKFRHLYDKALGDNDTRLALDVTDKEIKLSGLYVEKIEKGPPGSFAKWVKAVIEEKERRRKENSKPNR